MYRRKYVGGIVKQLFLLTLLCVHIAAKLANNWHQVVAVKVPNAVGRSGVEHAAPVLTFPDIDYLKFSGIISFVCSDGII